MTVMYSQLFTMRRLFYIYYKTHCALSALPVTDCLFGKYLLHFIHLKNRWKEEVMDFFLAPTSSQSACNTYNLQQ